MKLLNDIRFGPKLMLAFLAILALAGVIGVTAVIQLGKLATTADSLATGSLTSVYLVSELESNMTESRSDALEVLTRLQLNNAAAAKESEDAIQGLDDEMGVTQMSYRPLLHGDAQKKMWTEALAKWDVYKKEQDRAISVAQDGLAGEAQKILIGQAKAKFDSATGAIRALVDYNRAEADRARDSADRAAAAARRLVFILLGVAVAFGVTVAISMTSAITHPLRHTVSLLEKIGGGRLDNEIDLSRGDEIGQLLRGLASTQDALRQRAEEDRRHTESERQRAEADRRALEEVQDIVAAVIAGQLDRRIALTGKSGFAEQLANSLNGLVEQVAGVVSGVTRLVDSANGGDLSQRMYTEGRSGLEQKIGHAINQLVADMGTTVARVKEASAEVSRGANEISAGNASLSQRTEEQAASLEETTGSMEKMTSSVRQNAENARLANSLAIDARQRAEKGGEAAGSAVSAMQGISQASTRIADIIGVIDEIAFQTNLLALNAAVEAARAGDHGRGFAVVASEVRNLASRSAEAAKEIKSLIQDSVQRVENGGRLVAESGQTLGELVVAVKKVSDIIAEISAASAEQARGIDEVGGTISQLDEITQQNAALVEEAASASEALASQAQALDEMMARYKVAGESGLRAGARAGQRSTRPPAGRARVA
jgi:methyl-accepting chemotaxis protein